MTQTTNECGCAGKWVGDKYHCTICPQHVEELAKNMNKTPQNTKTTLGDNPEEDAARDVAPIIKKFRDDLESKTTPHEEYLRRNLVHAKAVGANANAKAALEKLIGLKRPQGWMIKALEGIVSRTEAVHPEIAKWRNSALDAPEYMK